MKISRSLFGAALVSLTATAASAQADAGRCPPGTLGPPPDRARATQDACQKTLDFFKFMFPQLGTSITGGNTTLGQGGALGGLGHFALSVRGNAILKGGLPRLDRVNPSYTGAVASNVETEELPIGLPAADAAIGIFRGLPLGVTNVGGIDLLVSAFFVPEITKDNVTLKAKDGSLKFGYGARIGLIQESLMWPGVSVSILKRDLPTLSLAAVSGSSNFQVNDFTVKTTATRLAVAKNLLIFGISAGIGQDKYKSTATVAGTVTAPLAGTQNIGPVTIDQDMTRSNMFVGASINLLVLKLVAEAGRVSGGDVATFNTFGSQKADDTRTYVSAGLRFGF